MCIRDRNQTKLSEKVGLPLPFGGGFIPQGAWLAPVSYTHLASIVIRERVGSSVGATVKLSMLNARWENKPTTRDVYKRQTIINSSCFLSRNFRRLDV